MPFLLRLLTALVVLSNLVHAERTTAACGGHAGFAALCVAAQRGKDGDSRVATAYLGGGRRPRFVEQIPALPVPEPANDVPREKQFPFRYGLARPSDID